MIKTLTDDFIPVAQDCAFTGRRKTDDALRRLFARITGQRSSKHWSAASVNTTQGYYAVRADGTLIRACAYMALQRTPDRIRAWLADALAEFRATRAPQERVDAERIAYYPAVPPGTLVAHVYCRISNGKRDYPWPADWEGQEGVLNAFPARDLIWIPRAEVTALLGGTVVASLRRRLLLGHLRDIVRGQPRLFAPAHVKLGKFTAKALRTAASVEVRLSGRFKIVAPSQRSDLSEQRIPAGGIQGTLDGVLRYDLTNKRVTRFLMHASCVAYGEYFLTPGAPPGAYALQIGFELAEEGDPIARSVPPHATGDDGTASSYLQTGRSYR